MTLWSKIRWIASILLVFTIVLITNIIDRENFNKMSHTVTTMYEDRIVAADLIFEMSRLIQDKQIATVINDTAFFQKKNTAINREMVVLIDAYKQTKLTDKEKHAFEQLQDEFKTLERIEQSNETIQTAELLESLEKVKQHLHDLSKIQLLEGRRQVFISDKAKDTIHLFTQGEIVFLVIMAIFVQVIILYKPKKRKEE